MSMYYSYQAVRLLTEERIREAEEAGRASALRDSSRSRRVGTRRGPSVLARVSRLVSRPEIPASCTC
jgi:hypothetical protein